MVFVISALPAIAADEPDANGRSHHVGVTQREFMDSDRTNWAGDGPRPVRVTVWYPSEPDGAAENVEENGRRWNLRRDGEIARFRQRHPLIMVSHDSGGDPTQMTWLGWFLAENGFIAAAVAHNGTEQEELNRRHPTLTDFFGWERARDVSVALDRLLAEPVFGSRIDRNRIGAAGFSLGGTTVLWLAGARLELDALRRSSPPPPPGIAEAIGERVAFAETDAVARQSVARSDNSYKDHRIRAVFALAPPMGAGFPAGGLQGIDVPVRIVVGAGDLVAPPESNARHFATHIPTARLEVVPGERGHYLAPIAAAQRQQEFGEVAAKALAFFKEELD